MNEVYKFIKNIDIKSDYIVAAISGGPDSMFLLDTLLRLNTQLNKKIVVAHVHHNLRKESDEEALSVQKFCRDNNLIFEFKKIQEYPNNKFSEETARKIRYEFFDSIIKKYNSDILFTAHHGDDLIETVLMRLTRGSSIKGYAGFERLSIDRGYIIARPLIFITKKEIEEYLDENNIWYAKDMSNQNDLYTRNRYRKYILPELKKENVNVHQKFCEYNNKIILADKYLKKQAYEVYDKVIKDNTIKIPEFLKLDDIIKIYLLEIYLKKTYKENISDISSKHIETIINLINNNVNAKIDLPNNMIGLLEYNCFRIISKPKVYTYEYTFNDSIDLPNGKSIYIDNDTKLTTNYVIHLNTNEIKFPLHVRTRKNGDKMHIKNMLGSKKVNDIFTDERVSKELRDTYPIVTDDTGKIIWIPGIKKSNLDRKNAGKYDIILKYN